MEIQEAIKLLEEMKENCKAMPFEYRDEKATLKAEAIDTVLAELDKQNEEIENYKNTIEVIEDLGRMKIEKQIELAKQKWGDK